MSTRPGGRRPVPGASSGGAGNNGPARTDYELTETTTASTEPPLAAEPTSQQSIRR